MMEWCRNFYQFSGSEPGKLVLDTKEIERREDRIVRNLLRKKGDCILILGGAHDLTDNIQRLATTCGYIRVTPKGFPGENSEMTEE